MPVKNQVVTENYATYNGDCIEVIAAIPKESIHFSLYSPPFAVDSSTGGGSAQFVYSSSDRDFSNARTYAEFFEQYEFLVREIHRVTLPGRISAVHCKDIPLDGANCCGYSDFPGDIIRLHQKCGFEYLPRICIWKEPLKERNRTMSKALAHRQIVEDSTRTNVAAGDYLLPFRKKGTNPIPVTHTHGLMSYAGERKIPEDRLGHRGWTGNQIENIYSHWIWRQYASCFWDDIRIGYVVNNEGAEESDDEAHQHPLQLDVITRGCELWSNPGETLWTPFAGVASEMVGAIKCGRKAIGAELKTAYYNKGVKNLANIQMTDEAEGKLFSDPDDGEMD